VRITNIIIRYYYYTRCTPGAGGGGGGGGGGASRWWSFGHAVGTADWRTIVGPEGGEGGRENGSGTEEKVGRRRLDLYRAGRLTLGQYYTSVFSANIGQYNFTLVRDSVHAVQSIR